MNNMNDQTDEWTQPGAPQAGEEEMLDPRVIASMALNDCPEWAGDIIAALPEGTDTPDARAEHGVSTARERLPVVTECPLHTAMRHLTEAAVSQHVLYLEGEVRSRPNLVDTIARWERMHTLIRECICPATREVAVGAAALNDIVDTTLDGMFGPGQTYLRTQFVQALEVCASCTSTAECPLGALPGSE